VLRSKPKIQDIHVVQKSDIELLDGQNINPSLLDLKATIEVQAQYINTLEDKIQEKQEVQRAQDQLRIRVSLSQLYRDILMMRNSGAIYVDMLIDGNKYQTLEAI
jgi:hypothetical protein